jgi:hypothetical protein
MPKKQVSGKKSTSTIGRPMNEQAQNEPSENERPASEGPKNEPAEEMAAPLRRTHQASRHDQQSPLGKGRQLSPRVLRPTSF